MKLMHLRLVGLLLFFCTATAVFAHPNNRREDVCPLQPNGLPSKVLYTLYSKNFLDNTEYFGKIMEGETVFGFHFSPFITYYFTESLGLHIGIIWYKKFGQIHPWDGIRPILSTYYKSKQAVFVVGIINLQAYLPNLLEPLFDPNRLLEKPCIEGFHCRIEHSKMYLAGWLDWHALLSKKSNKPEKFTLHLDAAYLHNACKNKCNWKIPFQLAVYHQGGQGIAVKTYSLFCGATGLSLCFMPSMHFFKQIHMAGHLCFNRYAKKMDMPSKVGWGQLYSMDWLFSYIRLNFSYWRGRDFSSENMGHRLYQSFRIEDGTVSCHETIRSLLFLSVSKEWLLYPNVIMQASFRPYYDCKKRLLEYGYGLTLSITDEINLKG